MQTWLAPLLRLARELTELKVVKHQWKYQSHRVTFWVALAAVVGSILVFLASRSN